MCSRSPQTPTASTVGPMYEDRRFALVPPAPCHSSADSSIAVEVVVDAHAALDVMPTGEWRRSMNARLHHLKEEVDSWRESQPSEGERRRVTAEALNFFCDIRDPPRHK